MAARRRSLSWLFVAFAVFAAGACSTPPDVERSEARLDAPSPEVGATAMGVDTETRDAEAPAATPRREPVPAGATPTIRIRLRGLHPDAPWTSKVTLHVTRWDVAAQESREDSLKVLLDDAGVATFVLPPWRESALIDHWYFSTDDRLYDSVIEGGWTFGAEVTTYDVEPRGVVSGRVVDARGAPAIGANVLLSAVHRSVPVTARLAAKTDGDGAFSVQMLPGVPYLVIAEPPEGTDALLAHFVVTTAIGKPLHLPDLVLDDGELVEGTVRWVDSAPIAAATLRIVAATGTSIDLDDPDRVPTPVWVDDQGQGFAVTAQTDAAGRFVLRMPTAARVEVAVVEAGRAKLHGELRRAVTAPGSVVFELPRPAVVRTTVNGREQRGARVEVASGTERVGRCPLVLLQPARIRATNGELRSAWLDLTLDRAGTDVDLPLTESLTPITIEVESGDPPQRPVVEWTSQDGTRLMTERRAFALPRGRWHLRILEREYRGGWRAEDTVDVGAEPVTVRVAPRRCGTFTVNATDRAGRFVPGTCRVIDASGNDLSAAFSVTPRSTSKSFRLLAPIRRGAVGELRYDGPNDFTGALLPGDYDLLFDFAGYGVRRERVTIRGGESTEVHVKL